MSEAKKVVVVTGATRGIGAAIASVFSKNHFAVAMLDVLPEGETLAKKLIAEGGDCLFLKCDVANESEVQSAVQQVIARFGTIDVLVNNAAIVLVAALEDIAWEQFQTVVNINLGGTFLLCKHVLPVMKQQQAGSIVNMASVSGHVGQVDHTIYGATKGAILALTRALAWEVAPYHIRVNSISPGAVDTPMLRGDVQLDAKKLGQDFETVKAEWESRQAFSRWADPQEIAETVYFLASNKASFITGSDLLVDCGWVAR
jgi:NAD(P)-dependent dehydrogenase (short-subunit alcohol dehydrogenase family)